MATGHIFAYFFSQNLESPKNSNQIQKIWEVSHNQKYDFLWRWGSGTNPLTSCTSSGKNSGKCGPLTKNIGKTTKNANFGMTTSMTVLETPARKSFAIFWRKYFFIRLPKIGRHTSFLPKYNVTLDVFHLIWPILEYLQPLN